MTKDELIEEARKYAEQSISLATSMMNPSAETIARYAYMAGYDSAFKELEREKKLKQRTKSRVIEITDKGRREVEK